MPMWMPVPRHFIVLADSSVAAAHTGDLVETALATVTIPANALGPNGKIRFSGLWGQTSSANNKIMRVRYSGITGTIYYTQTVTTSQTTQDIRYIGNRNATNSQVGGYAQVPGLSQANIARVTSAVDTTADTTLVYTAQLANAADTITLEAYTVELLYGA